MLLTRVHLKPCTYLTFLKKTPQNLHAAVAEAFNNEQVRWRLDHGNALWVLSPVEASSPQSLPGDFEARDISALQSALKPGTKVAFRLTANTVRSLAPENPNTRGKQVPCRTQADKESWLTSREHRLGGTLESFGITDAGEKRFSHKKSSIHLTWATFEGALTITEPEVLYETLTSGIGKKGGYGMGLLTIAPA